VLWATWTLLAFRRANPALREGGWAFLGLPTPLLGLTRGGGMACQFNLGDGEAEVSVAGAGTLTPVSRAVREGDIVRLPRRGFAWIPMPEGRLR